MSMNGIDIASYQAGIDLSVVPCDFVIVKATEGTSYVNPDFDRAYDQAVALGKKVGIYHYAASGGAQNEADYFLYMVGDRVHNAILVLDWEQGGNANFNNVSYAKAFLDRVFQKTGVRPLIYMSKSVCRQFNWSSVAPYYGLWVAQYANYNPTGYQSDPWTDAYGYGAWSSPVIFQYSSSGHLSGWNGNLDLNVAYMDATTWDKYAQGDNYVNGNDDGGEEMAQFTQEVADWLNNLYKNKDLPVSAWAEKDFNEAVSNGITTGERPKESLTREQGAIMCLRTLKKALSELEKETENLKERIQALENGGVDE